jgi:hypothetical protein
MMSVCVAIYIFCCRGVKLMRLDGYDKVNSVSVLTQLDEEDVGQVTQEGNLLAA